LSQLLRAAIEDGDVLAGVGVDAFEGPAVGVEVTEVAGHGGGATATEFSGAEWSAEDGNTLCQPRRLPALLASTVLGLGGC